MPILLAVLSIILIVIILIIVYKVKSRPKEKEIPTYKVSFVTNKDEVLSDILLKENTELPQVPTLIKDGYNFKGWYLDSELTKPLPRKFILENDITLYAKWEEQSVEEFLSFMNNQTIEKDILKKVRKTYKNDK